MRRNTHRGLAVLAVAGVCALSTLAVGFLGFGWASAGAQGADATFFGIDRQSQESPSNDVTPQTVDDKSAADFLVVEDISESASLQVASSRDVSAGVQEIAEEEEAARLAAEEAARAAEQRAIARADAARSRYYETFGSLPAGDVDFSIGREAFIEKWTLRINAYLAGSPLAGYGETFAEATWENGVDPRWSPAISNTESTKGRVCFKYHNAWGWDQSSWGDWDTAIRSHVAGLARGYGFTISYNYAKRYCPPNCDNWYRDTLAQMRTI